MSGGQQQLVSIMRALVVEPEILFLDEPFSALDYEMTLFMRDQLQRIFVETGTTTVLVSHDLEEAVYLADHVLLLSRRPGADRRLRAVRRRAPAHRRDAVASTDFVRIKAHCLEVFQREVRTRMKRGQFEPLSAAGRRRRPDRALVRRLSGCSVVDPVLLPSPTDDVPRVVEGHGRRQARLRFPADGRAHDRWRSRSRP